MTLKKYYQNDKLVRIGFDSLEELFAYHNNLDLLEPIEFRLYKGAKETIYKDPKFEKFVEEMKE